jgi:hypothetical protein
MSLLVSLVSEGGIACCGMPHEIARDEVQRLMTGGAQLVEVLPREEYEEQHLPHAISVPLRRSIRTPSSSSTPQPR